MTWYLIKHMHNFTFIPLLAINGIFVHGVYAFV
jgi:hypothetical protein